MARQVDQTLQEQLGDDFEVIFEVGALHVRRAGDRAFVAEYDLDENAVRAAPHVVFPGREGENHDDLAREGQRRLAKTIEQWRQEGFETTDEGHVMESGRPLANFHNEAPRYIQPMAKRVESVDEAARTIEWVRSHRH